MKYSCLTGEGNTALHHIADTDSPKYFVSIHYVESVLAQANVF